MTKSSSSGTKLLILLCRYVSPAVSNAPITDWFANMTLVNETPCQKLEIEALVSFSISTLFTTFLLRW